VTSRVGILFDGQDRVSGTISRIKSGLTSLNDSVSPLNAALTGGIVGGAAVLGFQALGQAIEATVETAKEAAQVERLRAEYAVYLLRSGRICVAGLNSGNVERAAEAIAAVID